MGVPRREARPDAQRRQRAAMDVGRARHRNRHPYLHDTRVPVASVAEADWRAPVARRRACDLCRSLRQRNIANAPRRSAAGIPRLEATEHTGFNRVSVNHGGTIIRRRLARHRNRCGCDAHAAAGRSSPRRRRARRADPRGGIVVLVRSPAPA